MILTIAGVTMNGGILTPNQIKSLTPDQVNAIRHQSDAPDPVTGALARPIFLPLSVLSGRSDQYIATHSIDNSSVPIITNNLNVDAGSNKQGTNAYVSASKMKDKILQTVQGKATESLDIVT